MRHSRWLFLFAAGLLLASAALLRFSQIGRRPFHADEAVQAFQTWRLLRGEGYTYDPADKHGPFLYYAAAGFARVAGWTPAALDETRLRAVTLLGGLGTLALFLGASAWLGRLPALLGAALLAAAPLAVIYDTYFVQEAWFCFFTWALFFAILRLLDRPTLPLAMLAGALAGLMQATKETSVIHFAALGAAVLIIRPLKQWRRDYQSRSTSASQSPNRGTDSPASIQTATSSATITNTRARLWPLLLAALLSALFIYLVFYSAFFTRWAGVADGIRTYFNYAVRAAASPHSQPWYFYLSVFWPHTNEGARWGEPLLALGALLGALTACSARASVTHRATAAFTLTLLLLYSIIPYKTPWLLLTPYAGLALLAGLGIVHSVAWLPARLARVVPICLGLFLLLESGLQDIPALGRYASDPRNPYLYQQTSPQFPALVARLRELAAESGRPLLVAVVSPDHAWPLPWYLRGQPTVGYFATPPPSLADYDLALFDSRLFEAPPPVGVEYFGLRPDVVLALQRFPARR